MITRCFSEQCLHFHRAPIKICIIFIIIIIFIFKYLKIPLKLSTRTVRSCTHACGVLHIKRACFYTSRVSLLTHYCMNILYICTTLGSAHIFIMNIWIKPFFLLYQIMQLKNYCVLLCLCVCVRAGTLNSQLIVGILSLTVNC